MAKRKQSYIHRKIYEEHFGSVPKDAYGRSFDIHHIDGNPSNNEITNLKAVSIEEHYNIHYAQGDWAACKMIALQRLNKSADEISKLNSLAVRKQIEDGKHLFKNSEFQKEMSRRGNEKQIKNGTHPFLDGTRTKERNLRNSALGIHPFQNKEKMKEYKQKRLDDGTHNFIGPNSPTQQQWTCERCHKTGKNKGMFSRWHGVNCKIK